MRQGQRAAVKPANLSCDHAAAVPQAGLVALQALRDAGHLAEGQHVLVNGASSESGTFAVQIAKALGAEVTAVCGARSIDMARSLGADHVIDYAQEVFTEGEARYDLIFDNVAGRPASVYVGVLNPRGAYVSIPFSATAMARGMGRMSRGGKRAVQFSHGRSVPDLNRMRELIESCRVTPVIDQVYPLDEVFDGMEYYGQGHARGKVVISVRGAS